MKTLIGKNKNPKRIKLIVLFFLSLISGVMLLFINKGRFISLSSLIMVWGTDYYTDTTKIMFLGFVISAIVVGFSSTSIQNINGNPIASSSTLGIGASASFGYIIANYFMIFDYYFIVIIMVVSSIVPVMINYLLVRGKNGDRNSVILVGLAITVLIGVVNFILRKQMGMLNGQMIFLGTMGNTITWPKFYYVLPMFFVGMVMLGTNFKKINVINYSKELADKQHINFNRVFFQTSIGNILLISAAVFLIGEISFLGIVGTNLVRMIIKSDSTWSLAIAASMFNIIIIFLARIMFLYLNIDINLSIVVVSIPIFLMVIFGRKRYA